MNSAGDKTMTKGERVINGRVLLLAGRHIGAEAKEDARKQADRLRKTHEYVRVIRNSIVDYSVFAL